MISHGLYFRDLSQTIWHLMKNRIDVHLKTNKMRTYNSNKHFSNERKISQSINWQYTQQRKNLIDIKGSTGVKTIENGREEKQTHMYY